MTPEESIQRLAKLVRRLNPDQYVTVDVESVVHLLAAREILKGTNDSVKHDYSISSELDADEWDAEFMRKFKGRL